MNGLRNDEQAEQKDGDYWYDHCHELQEGMVFRLSDESLVKLDRSVPGDGTKWYVADWWEGRELNGRWYKGSWSYQDSTIEPSDLVGDPIVGDIEV